MTLPLTALLAVGVWLLSGLVEHGWWEQLLCMGLSVYLLIELSNSNALIRIRSRMVSCTFIVLMCCHTMLFASMSGNFVTLCLITAFMLLFSTYQNQEAMGRTFYAYFFIGMASIVQVHMLYFVPLFWLLSITHLQSLSWRSWIASFLGIATPYWLALPWILYNENYQSIRTHFVQLCTFHHTFDFSSISVAQRASSAFILVLTIIAILNFWRRSFEDRIRTRQFFGFFGWTGLTAAMLFIVQPQLYDAMMRIAIVCACPFIAHFFSLRRSKATNVLFIMSCVAAVLLIVVSLFPHLPQQLFLFAMTLWSGL